MAKMSGLAHIGVFVTDLERSKAFYRDMLEFEVIHECQLANEDGMVDIAFVRNGTLTLELVRFPNPKQNVDGWVDHIAIAVEDIEAIKKMLEERGLQFEEPAITHAPGVMPNGAKWIMFRGPDGEHLELNEVL